MLVGLILSAGATTATTNADPQAFSGVGSLPLALPLLIPIAVLAVPFVDLVLAVIRRVARGQSPFAPDKQHLHHRLLELGHSHRRAVLLLYFWSALLALGGVAVSIYRGPWAIVVVVLVGAVGGVFSLVPGLRARRATPALPPGTIPAVPPGGGRIADRVKP
jgi:UDP-GlcNAc:undecaprenyl-phosphate GlcNAc-1-phosphate transferase